ncbi:MAG: cytochrome c peroxidase [Bacteroidota bacterium]
MYSFYPLTVYACFAIFGLTACSPDPDATVIDPTPVIVQEPKSSVRTLQLPATPYPYSHISLPLYFSQNEVLKSFAETSLTNEDNLPPENPITDHGATLGRVLFYDQSLSANSQVSCASCHQQALGFSDPRRQSLGFAGKKTRRHAMALINVRYYRRARFLWDERASSLEEQVLLPFFDEIEMGLTPDSLVSIISRTSYYPSLFEKAFGSREITLERISLALAQFLRSIVSYRSKYDEGRMQVSSISDDFPNFTPSENLGKHLFLSRIKNGFSCFECHTTEGFIGTPVGPQNNGLDRRSGADRGAIESQPDRPGFEGSFKIPTLRNIALSAPYMHDGRFRTLMDVVNHYNQGIEAHPHLSSLLKASDGQPIRLELSEEEKQALVDFLHSLTDFALINDPMFTDPF